MTFRVEQPPQDTKLLASYCRRMFERVEGALRSVSGVQLDELHVAPTKPRTGVIVLADGTDWNPGSGQGVYCYYNGTWNKLG